MEYFGNAKGVLIGAVLALLVVDPIPAKARQGDFPPCDPVILGQSNVIFDFSITHNAGQVNQDACASAEGYFGVENQSQCYVFSGEDFESVTDEMRASHTPFGGIVVRAPDASILGDGKLFMGAGRPLSDTMFIEISPDFVPKGF
ncbi:MAG: hypothetical protein ABJL67_15885 [Sulfitobacter sp.]